MNRNFVPQIGTIKYDCNNVNNSRLEIFVGHTDILLADKLLTNKEIQKSVKLG